MTRRNRRLQNLEHLESRWLLAGDLAGITINEVVAANRASAETRVREEADDRFRGEMLTPDWIELRNSTDADVDLSGAALTDDPKHFARWTFPDGAAIQANGYLVVFASGLDITSAELDETGHLHAGFKLSAGGEYLALLDDAGTVADSIDSYPKLDADLAYGRDPGGNFALLTATTIGADNALAFRGEVADTEFSVNRGFFTESFSVELSTPTDGAEIRYTTDGSEPTASHGNVYAAPIEIATTTNLRAAAFKEGYVATDVDTQTYVFISDVAKQPAEIEGFPFGGRVWAGQNTYVPQDTEMDPDIVNDPAYAEVLDEALLAIPTMSITSEQDQIFGNDGWYDGENIEGAVSVEILYPDDPTSNQQINAGIESHSHDRLKRSLRLNFREVYGDSRFETDFFQRSPVTGDSATDQFNAIVLRGGNNRSWARVWNPDKTAYAIDEFFRSSQVAMSGYGMRGQVAHLYINGVYWGLYNPVERADQNFGAEYFGGDADDWFTLNHGGDLAGNDDRWDVLRRMSRDDMTVDENYQTLKEHLDVDAFIDYLIISWWTAVSDWPQNNYYGTNRNESANLDPEPFRFVGWDGEWSWGQGGQSSRDGRAHVHPDFRASRRGGQPIPSLWHAARANPEFMTAFRDRVYMHLHGDGALTEANAQERWTALTEMVREAVVAESARWGDSLEDARRPTRTRDGDWQREVDRIRGLIDGNNESFLAALRTEGFYPEFDPPQMIVDGESATGGKVAPGTQVTFEDSAGDAMIYVALDGNDPRSPDGSVSAAAMQINPGDSIPIDRLTSISVRKKAGDEWSAANRATFTIGGDSTIKISEINFNPGDPTPAEVEVGLTDNDMFEFVEVVNTSEHAVDLDGFHFASGIELQLSNTTIGPNEIAVIPRNAKAFRFRHGNDITVLGEFASTGLSNGGEQLTLIDPSGDVVFQGMYDDSDEWPEADGNGNSLQRLSLGSDFGGATDWVAATPTPGMLPTTDTDLNDDGVTNSADVDLVCSQISAGDISFDLDGDGSLDSNDLDFYIVTLLGTSAGDANLDGIFNSADLVTVFRSAQYEDSIAGNSGWADGDWNCDGDFTTSDLVEAFRAGKYVAAANVSGAQFAEDVAFSISTDEIDDDKELREFGGSYSSNSFAWLV